MVPRFKISNANGGELAPPSRSWLRSDWVLGVVLVLAVIATYSPVWRAGFVWDDKVFVSANPVIVGPLGLKEIWTTHAGSVSPLTLTTFWLENALWGMAPMPYHLVNVLLHAACALVLWQVLRGLRIPGAWFGAALWALHPLQVESVAWISETKNTQSCFFYLLTILFFVKSLETKAGGWNYTLTLLFAALAIASKFSTIVLPVVLGLCAWWIEGRWQWRHLIRLAPIFFMSAVAGALTFWLGTVEPGLPGEATARSWPELIAMAGDAFWFYVGKLFWPHPLMAIYPRWTIDASQWTSYLPVLAAIVILVIVWLKRQTWARPSFFALGYFLVVMLPFLGFIYQSFWRYSYVEDHLQYLAGMGLLALAGAGGIGLANSFFPGKPSLPAILGAAILLVLATLSWQRAWAFENDETLWTDNLAKNPNCWVGQNNLGIALFQKGQTEQAILHFQKALELNPNNAESHGNLGMALCLKGQVGEGMKHFQKALELSPNDGGVFFNLGVVLFQQGQLDQAMTQFQKALNVHPVYDVINANQGRIYDYLGKIFVRKGQLNEALTQFQNASAFSPNDAEVRSNLGVLLFQTGRADEATTQFQKALALNPDDAEAHNNLGIVLAKEGRTSEAIDQFKAALRLNPDFLNARKSLEKAEAQLQQPSVSN